MSRHGLRFRGFKDLSVCGWDRQLGSYWAQVWPNGGDPDDPPPFWLGARPHEVPTVEALAVGLAPFGRLGNRLRAALRADAAAEPAAPMSEMLVLDEVGRAVLVDAEAMYRMSRGGQVNPSLPRRGLLARCWPFSVRHRRRLTRLLTAAAAAPRARVEPDRTIPAVTTFPDRAPQALWLDVPFDDNDTVKQLGARWDQQRRAWYAPAGTPLVPLLPWLADLPLDAEPHLTVRLFGLTVTCWRCGSPTCCVVGLMDADTLENDDLIGADDPFVLRVADRLLDDRRRGEHRIGAIRPRFSKTANATYLSNGCVSCDALQGEFFLFHEELPQALAEEGVAGLDSLGLYAIPSVVFAVMTERSFG